MEDVLVAEETNVTSPVPIVDLTKLESELTQLVDVLQKDQEQKKIEAEKLAKEEAAQKKVEAAQAKLDAENEKLTAKELQAKEAAQEEQSTTVMTLQEQQASDLSDTLVEIQSLNENTVALIEKLDHQETVIVEGAFMVTIAVILSASVKLLVEQISKW